VAVMAIYDLRVTAKSPKCGHMNFWRTRPMVFAEDEACFCQAVSLCGFYCFPKELCKRSSERFRWLGWPVEAFGTNYVEVFKCDAWTSAV